MPFCLQLAPAVRERPVRGVYQRTRDGKPWSRTTILELAMRPLGRESETRTDTLRTSFGDMPAAMLRSVNASRCSVSPHSFPLRGFVFAPARGSEKTRRGIAAYSMRRPERG